MGSAPFRCAARRVRHHPFHRLVALFYTISGDNGSSFVFCTIFTDPPQKDQRENRQTKENAGKISHPVTQKRNRGLSGRSSRWRRPVRRPPCRSGGPRRRYPGDGGKRPKSHPEAKEKIQQTAQPAPPAPAAEDAEAVIHHPGPQAQAQGREEGGELAGNGDTHGSAEQAGKRDRPVHSRRSS